MPIAPLLPRRRTRTTTSDFALFWLGETVSLFGSQVTSLALPLTAALTLGANAAQMGILSAAQTAPAVLFGLFAGVWADRARRRPLLIGANLARALLIGSIPVAAMLGVLGLPQLYAVAFLSGVGTIVFVVAYQAYLPSLLPAERLVEANAKLRASSAVAEVAGPSLGGLLVQFLGAPVALTADALSFLCTISCTLRIRTVEAPPTHAPLDVRGEITAAACVVWRDSVLRSATIWTGAVELFVCMGGAVYVLFAVRDLGIGPAALGGIAAASGPAALFGAILAHRVVGRYGVGRTLTAAALLGGVTAVLPPLAAGPAILAAALLALARVGAGLADATNSVILYTLVQTIPHPSIQGRVNAFVRVAAYGAMALGALLGGFLGTVLGLRAVLAITAAGLLGAALWLHRSPLGALGALPAPPSVGVEDSPPEATRE